MAAVELRARGLLQDVPRDAGLEEPPDVLAVVVLREHQDARARAQLADLERRLEAAQARHRDVHHGDVGLEGLRPRDGLAAVGGLADHLHVVGQVEERLHAFADDGVVVGDAARGS